MADYTQDAAESLAMIRADGGPFRLTKKQPGAYDPVAMTETGAQVQVFDTVAVGFPPGKSAEKEIGSLVNRRLLEVYVPALGLPSDPAAGDEALFGGTAWTVVWVYTIRPDGVTPILHKLYLEA